MSQDQPIILLGAGGHAQVLIDLLLFCKKKILGFVDPHVTEIENYDSLQYLGTDDDLKKFPAREIQLVNGIGSISVDGNLKRKELFLKAKEQGYSFATLCHPCAIISPTVILQEGVQVMAGAVIQTGTQIGVNTIINTRSSVDHHCFIESHVHIAPGVTLSGNVTIREAAFVGVGTTVIQNIQIDKNIMIKAGMTVIKNILSTEK